MLLTIAYLFCMALVAMAIRLLPRLKDIKFFKGYISDESIKIATGIIIAYTVVQMIIAPIFVTLGNGVLGRLPFIY
ncbi:hypothetical protein JNJ66_02975 [Candidatus Saccharibacteria bacterium]|nr:hypothetical protein [Candidatus Saccharibacteria bacterium]